LGTVGHKITGAPDGLTEVEIVTGPASAGRPELDEKIRAMKGKTARSGRRIDCERARADETDGFMIERME
jgi:hypothetical protein